MSRLSKISNALKNDNLEEICKLFDICIDDINNINNIENVFDSIEDFELLTKGILESDKESILEFIEIVSNYKNMESKIKYKDGDNSRIPDGLVEELLCKYGPEGCYELADKLKDAANKDVSDALNDKK